MSIVSTETKVKIKTLICAPVLIRLDSLWKGELLPLEKREEGIKRHTLFVEALLFRETIYRSASPEEELDEFGRVKGRREKFKTERSEEDGEYDDGHRSDSIDRGRREDRYHSRRRRRSSSSPRRYRRHHSDSDSDYDRHRSSSRHGRHRSHHHRQQNRGNGADVSFLCLN